MADENFTTNLNFQTNATPASRSIEEITKNVKRLEEELQRLYKSSKAEDIDKVATTRNLIAEEGLRITRLQNLEIRKQREAEKALASLSSERVKKQFEQIKSNSILLGEFNKRIQGKSITTIPDIQQQILAEAPQLIKKIENARKEELRTAVQAHSIKARLYAREATILTKQAADIRQNAEILKGQAERFGAIAQLALGAGVGITGGIFAFASKYVRDAKEATETTIAWKAAQESLAKSGSRIGAVFAQEALPLLKLAAQTAEKAAQFVEAHPDIVRAALNTGIVLAGLGALGTAVTKGIKFYADQQILASIPLQLQAGELQLAAAHEQLAAVRLRSGLPGGGLPSQNLPLPKGPVGIGNILQTAAKITLVASSVLIGAELGVALGNAIAKFLDPKSKDMNLKETLFFGGVRPVEAIVQKIQEAEKNFLQFITLTDEGDKNLEKIFGKAGGVLQSIDQMFQKMILGVKETTAATGGPISGVRGSEKFEEILKAYENYRRDDLELVRRHYAERQNIISQSMADQARVTREYLANVGRINSQTGSAIRQATQSYEQETIRAEQQYAQQRAQIIRDSGSEIQRIEEQLQENLRKLRQDHEDRLGELVAARDALGIVKEQQRYNREKAEAIRSTNLEIRQRRQDLAQRLQDLAQNYQQERAQRFADFQARLHEIRANAGEQLRELQARHYEELNEIRANRVARLRELDNQLREERQRRYEYFIAQIRDLDSVLLGERNLRKQRQDEMIAELDAFLVAYKKGLGSILSAVPPAPTNARGGYATYGMHLLGDAIGGGRGKPEYVLRGDVTELAERVLGGRITQEKMAAFLAAANGGSSNSVIYNDSRRFDSRVSPIDREQMIDDTLSTLKLALR